MSSPNSAPSLPRPYAALTNLPPATALRAALRATDRAFAAGSLAHFIQLLWPAVEPSRPLVWGWHLDAICAFLEAISAGDIQRGLINISPGSMKEVHVDEPVLTRRGRIRLGDVVVGDSILTHRGRFRRVLAVHDKGQQDTLSIETQSGRRVRAEVRHPFLTTRGWIEARHLRIGDIAAAVSPEVEGFADQVSPEEARLLGYLVGDGGVTHSPAFTNADPDVLDDFEHCCRTVGIETARRRQTPSSKAKNAKATLVGMRGALDLLERHDLRGKSSYTKRIPAAVLRSGWEIIANFVGAYWSCDGTVAVRHHRRRGDQHIAQCTTVSEGLARDLQHALLRLGIGSRVRHHVRRMESKKQPGGEYHYWMVISSTHEDAAKFADLAALCPRKRAPLAALTPQRFRQGPLFEDEIVAVEPAGVGECRCLTVEDDHSFTAGDLAVHNSLAVDVFWPAWEWGPRNRPALRYLCASYSEALTLRDNIRFRNVITSETYQQLWGDRFGPSKDQWNIVKVANDKTGWKLATSVGGVGTGERGDRVIIDDPHSSKDPESEAKRASTLQWFSEVVPTRLNDPMTSPILVIMQRVHEDDVSGFILSKELGYEHLMIPMEYDSRRHCSLPSIRFEDPRTEDGELMWPARMPREVVDRDKLVMGPYATASQFAQSPTPRGGGIFKRDWWRAWPPEGEEFDDAGRPLKPLSYPPMDFVLASLDTALTTKEENDWSALTMWGIFRDDRDLLKIMLMQAWHERLEFHPLVEKALATCRKAKVDRLLIEAKANGISVAQEIVRLATGEEFGVSLSEPRGDKVARAYAVQHLWSAGVIYAPDRRWADLVIDEMATFPKGKHDDFVDSATAAMAHLRKIGLALLREERERDLTARAAPSGPEVQLYDV